MLFILRGQTLRQKSTPREPLYSLTPKSLCKTNSDIPSSKLGAESTSRFTDQVSAGRKLHPQHPQHAKCSPGRPALEPPNGHSGQERGESGITLPGAASGVGVAVAGSCVLHQGCRVSRAVTSPSAEKSWAAAGLPPSVRPQPGARVPAAPVLSAAARELALSPLEAEPWR